MGNLGMLEVTLGAALAIPFIVWAGGRGSRGERMVYGIGLVIAALIYLVFSLVGGVRDLETLGLETLGLIVFSLVAFLGFKAHFGFLGLGWFSHVGWDYWLHPPEPGSPVPEWYPGLCVGFDLVLAVHIAYRVVGPQRVSKR